MIVSSDRRAFTLVETLVVVGIIALLVGIMVPTIKMVQAESRNAGCLSNLHQNYEALQSYQAANRGILAMCEFIPVVTPDGIEGGLPNLLSKYIPVDSASWFCPADFDSESTETGTSYTYMPGLLRYAPEIQFEVLQALFLLPPSTIERQRMRVRLETESKLVARIFENDTSGLFPLLMDSEDRHFGTREPRNGVYLDGSSRAIVIEANTAVE
ncbi:MAG: type II secretion system protein [Phycisphaerales bacterium]|nr:type II secretion system protein [Phycisphaerales bacterium]